MTYLACITPFALLRLGWLFYEGFKTERQHEA